MRQRVESTRGGSTGRDDPGIEPDDRGANPVADGPLAVLESFVDAVLNGSDPGRIRALIAEDFTDHDPLPGQQQGLGGVEGAVALLREQGTSAVFHLEDAFVVDDKIAYRIFASGEIRPDHAGIRRQAPVIFTLRSTGIYRIRTGRLVERWGAWIYEEDRSHGI